MGNEESQVRPEVQGIKNDSEKIKSSEEEESLPGPLEHESDSSDDEQLEEILRQQKIAEFKKKIEAKREEFQQLRNANSIDDALKALNHLGNCLNDIEPSHAEKFFFNHPHVGHFAKKSENDEQGEKFEGGVAAKVLFIVCNTYTKPKYQLGVGPLNDSVTVAVNHKKMGYKVVYLHNSTPKHFKKWLQFVLEKTTTDLTIFYTGHGCSIVDTSGDESDGYDEVMLFDSGYVVDDELAQYLAKYAHGQRIVLLTDCCHSGSMWDIQSQPSMKEIIPPNIISISAAKDDQTAKQTKVKAKDQGIFTYYFWNVIEENQDISPRDMEKKLNPSISRYKQHFTYATTSPEMIDQPIFPHRERPPRRHQKGGKMPQ